MELARLPVLDVHTTMVAASIDAVWAPLLETLDRTFSRPGASGFARLVGCADSAASGSRPLARGATIPGFRVAAAVPGRELVLEGRHRFSSYALIFCLERVGAGSTLLRAESRADFPGFPGRVYRLIVVGTGGHVIAVRRLLSAVRRRSEYRA